MALKAKVTALDEIDEGQRSFYRQEGDHFVLDIEGVDGWELQDVSGLKKSLASERDRVRKLERDSREAKNGSEGLQRVLEDAGFTRDDETGDWKAPAPQEGGKGNEAELRQKLTEEITARLEKRFVEPLKRQLDEAKQREQADTERFQKVAVQSEALRVMSDPNVKGNPELLMPVISTRTRTVRNEETGALEVQVVTPEGETAFDDEGKALTVEGLVRSLHQDNKYAAAFEASGQSGGGTPPGSKAGGNRGTQLTAEQVGSLPYADYKRLREKGEIQ